MSLASGLRSTPRSRKEAVPAEPAICAAVPPPGRRRRTGRFDLSRPRWRRPPRRGRRRRRVLSSSLMPTPMAAPNGHLTATTVAVRCFNAAPSPVPSTPGPRSVPSRPRAEVPFRVEFGTASKMAANAAGMRVMASSEQERRSIARHRPPSCRRRWSSHRSVAWSRTWACCRRAHPLPRLRGPIPSPLQRVIRRRCSRRIPR